MPNLLDLFELKGLPSGLKNDLKITSVVLRRECDAVRHRTGVFLKEGCGTLGITFKATIRVAEWLANHNSTPRGLTITCGENSYKIITFSEQEQLDDSRPKTSGVSSYQALLDLYDNG